MHVDDVREDVARLAVDVLADRRSRDERAAMANHQLEDRVLARGQLDRHVLAIHQPRRPVDGDIADDEHRRGIAAGSPHERAKARHELGDGKGLRQIIVGAKIERLDAIVDGVERRQNQHRRARARLPQILQQRPAAALRHHQVEHHRIVGHFAEHVLRFVAIRGDVDGKVRLAERTAQRAGQIGLILDDEHSHCFLIAAGAVWRILGFVFDAEVVEHDGGVAAGPEPDAGAACAAGGRAR